MKRVTVDNNTVLDSLGDSWSGYGFENNTGRISIVNNGRIKGYGIAGKYNTGGITFSNNEYIHYMDFQSNSCDFSITDNTVIDEIIGHDNNTGGGSTFLVDNNTTVGFGLFGAADDFSVTNNSLVNISTYGGMSGWAGYGGGLGADAEFRVYVGNNSIINGNLWCQNSEIVEFVDNTIVNVNLHFDNIYNGGVGLLNNAAINGSFEGQNNDYVNLLGNTAINNTISIQNSTISIANNSLSGNFVSLLNYDQIDVLYNVATAPIMIRAGSSSTGVSIANNPLLRQVSINNNGYAIVPQISNNTIKGATNLGLSVTLGGASIVGNNIFSCGGGIGIDAGSGQITISRNLIYSNTNTGSLPGGIGLSDLAGSASVLVDNNTLYNNSGWRIGSIGVTNSNTTDVTIFSNYVYDNDESGIGIRDSDYVTIRNNLILSNGSADTQVSDEHFGFGVQLRDSIFAYNNIYSNIIRHNRFAGIGAYGVTGTIGPNNEVKYNGDQANGVSCGVLTSGYGGLSARELGGTLRVYDYIGATWDEATNMIIDNYNKDTALRPGSTGSTLYYNDEDILNKWVGPSDAVYYYNGISQTTQTNLNCNNGTIDATGYAYGVIIIGENADVEVQNCTITNAATSYSDLQYKGSGDSMGGAGILIAAGATANIHDNWIRDNGFQMTSGRVAEDNGNPSTDPVLNYFWHGAGAGDEFGDNQISILVPQLSSAQNKILYFYTGNPDVTPMDVSEAITITFYKPGQMHPESGLVSYWNFDQNILDNKSNNDGTVELAAGSPNPQAINYLGNDGRYVQGLIFMNQRTGAWAPGESFWMYRAKENFGEDVYLSTASGASDLDITGDQSIVFWASTLGPAYTRERSTDGTGGVRLNFRDDGSIEFKIADLGDANIHTCVTPDNTFDPESIGSGSAKMVAAVYDYSSVGSGQMKVYFDGSLISSKDVPQGFSPGYDANSISYLGGSDLDDDGTIRVGESMNGVMDEVLIYSVTLTEKRIEALHYHREYDETVEANDWPTVTIGVGETGPYTVDGETFPSRWPISIDNVNTNLYSFQVGPVWFKSPDSGGVLMRCVDSDVTVHNNEMYDNRRDGISGYDLDGTGIGYNSVKNNARFGIGMTSTVNNVSVHNNYVYQNDRGIGGSFLEQGATHYSIVNNHLNDNDKTSMGWKRMGIALTASNAKVYIGGNLIEKGVNAVGIQNMNGSYTDITFENNTIQNNTGDAFKAESWVADTHLLVKDNVFWGNTKPFKLRFMPGAYADLDNNYFDAIWVAGNIKRGNTSGFEANDSGYTTIQNNTFNNFGYTASGHDRLAAIRFQFLGNNSGMVIDNNYLYNNRFNGISFQDCSGADESISITNNHLYMNGCRRVGKRNTALTGGCSPTSIVDVARNGTISNIAALEFREMENQGMVYIANNLIDSNYMDAIKFQDNSASNVTLENNTITSNVAYFAAMGTVSVSNTLQPTNTFVYSATISTVTTEEYDIVGSSAKEYIDNITLSNNPGLGGPESYIGLHLLTDGTPADVSIYSYNTTSNIAWIGYESGGEDYTTFSNKPTDSSIYTMDDPSFIYNTTDTITLANSASTVGNYYAGLMITISNFATGVDVAGSQPGPDDEVTLGNNADNSTDNYYAGYHLIDADADLEYNKINSYDSSTKIAYMNIGYETKPSGTADVGYPIKYISEYDATTKEVIIAGKYPNVPMGGDTYTIEGGAIGNSGYVDGTGMQFRDITDGTLLVKNTTITNNWRGLWFRHIPNTNNNYSNPNLLIQGNIIEYNMGIGIRVDEVANVVLGDVNYIPSVLYQGHVYSRMNGMRGEPGLFVYADGSNSVTRSAKRDALVANAIANGGNSVFKNGSWGGQLQGWGDYGYETNIWVNGGQFRGNGSQGIGTKGDQCNVTVYNTFFGGQADAIGVQQGGNLIFNNSVAMGADAVHSTAGGKVIAENYSYIHTFLKNAGTGRLAELTGHSYVACMQICGIWKHGGSGGSADVSDYGYIQTARFIGGGLTVHDHGGVGMFAAEYSNGLTMYDGGFAGCVAKRFSGGKIWGYKSLANTNDPHPNNLNGIGTCMSWADGGIIQGNNVYGGIGYGRSGHYIGYNYVTGGIGPAGDQSSATIEGNWSSDPPGPIDCGHSGSCPNSQACP